MVAPPTLILIALAISSCAPQGDATSALPDGVRAMLDAAIAGGDAKAVETATDLARQTHPLAVAEIDHLATQWRLRSAGESAQRKQQLDERSEQAGLLENWKGQLELGASRSTGRNSYVGVLGSIELERQGLRWRHKVQARVELQDGRNVAAVERVVTAWQPNLKFGNELYGFGLAQYERDPAQGVDGRFTAATGIGYTALKSDVAKLDLESGPAVRYIDQVMGPPSSSMALRASLNFNWVITPTLELKQTGAIYLEKQDKNATALTAIDAHLLGPLKARFSYDMRYESRQETGGSTLDTMSRATLIYHF